MSCREKADLSQVQVSQILVSVYFGKPEITTFHYYLIHRDIKLQIKFPIEMTIMMIMEVHYGRCSRCWKMEKVYLLSHRFNQYQPWGNNSLYRQFFFFLLGALPQHLSPNVPSPGLQAIAHHPALAITGNAPGYSGYGHFYCHLLEPMPLPVLTLNAPWLV